MTRCVIIVAVVVIVIESHSSSCYSTLRTPWSNCYRTVTFRTCFSAFHCLPAPSVSHAGEAITKTIPHDWWKLTKLILRKWTFLLPRSLLIHQFVKRHLVTIRREQHVLAQWLRQYFCQDHCMRSVLLQLLCTSTQNSFWILALIFTAEMESQSTVQFRILLVRGSFSCFCFLNHTQGSGYFKESLI